MLTIQQVLERLPKAKRSGSGWRSPCPAHGGDRPDTLSFSEGNKLGVVFKCFKGCSYEEIVKSIGLWDEGQFGHANFPWREFVFDYVGHDGELLYQVVRSEPIERIAKGEKRFVQRRPDGQGHWVWHMDCSDEKKCRDGMSRPELNHEPLSPAKPTRVPYALQELLIAARTKSRVYLVEGEKKADVLAAKLGVTATTTVGGAKNWRDEYGSYFDGLDVVILPDNDPEGAQYAETAERTLQGKAKSIVILELPGLKPKEDVEDWLAVPTNDLTKLNELVRARTPKELDYNPVAITRTWSEWATDDKIRRLKGFLRDDVLVRTEVSMIYGPGGSGKSYLAKYIGICVAMAFPVHDMPTRQGRVLFLSEEMPHHVIHARTQRMLSRESGDELGDRFLIRCQSEFDFALQIKESQKRLEKIITECKAELVFVDCLADIHSGEENSNTEMGLVLKSVRAVARFTNTSIVLVHHMGKPGEDGKSKGARGASIMGDKCETRIEVKPIGKEGEPRSLVTFEKARHVVGMKPPSFEFVQEQDPRRLINVADPDETEILKPAIVFSTADHHDVSASDRDVVKVREVVSRLALNYEDGQVPSPLVTEELTRNGISKTRAVLSVKRAKSVGVVVSVSGGRKLCIPGS